MRKIVILISILGILFLNAKDLQDEENTKLLAQKSAIEFGKGNYKKSIDILRENWPLPTEEIDNLIYQTQSQMQLVATRFGEKVGYDYVKTEKIGDSFIKYIYISKFKNHAIRLNYLFYKAEGKWKLNSFIWDDKVHLLFD